MRWQIRLLNWLTRRAYQRQALECGACGANLITMRVHGIDLYVCPNGCGGE